MGAMASQITGVSIVYSTVCSGADQRKRQSSASLAFVWGIHRWPVNSPHKGPVMRKMFPFDDFIMDNTVPWKLIRASLSRKHLINVKMHDISVRYTYRIRQVWGSSLPWALRGQSKMAVILLTTFLNVLAWIRMFALRFKLHLNMLSVFKSTIDKHRFR